MNFSQIIRTARNAVDITCSLPATAGVYAFLVASLCRMFCDMTSGTALAWIAGPLCVVFGILAGLFLPDSLRKANITDERRQACRRSWQSPLTCPAI
ncbi:hypothetical protein [Janthinobacterium sp. ROICE36]|uniref:hypothetical protein n=1 Tax=Janthinobacterium sp. ROICE36 TaxID=2048670 RepID=UPI0011AF48E1|nr:hypothetical protein [Janthinobacterium sp. ROICE36]